MSYVYKSNLGKWNGMKSNYIHSNNSDDDQTIRTSDAITHKTDNKFVSFHTALHCTTVHCKCVRDVGLDFEEANSHAKTQQKENFQKKNAVVESLENHFQMVE